jgi:hypothetical protein
MNDLKDKEPSKSAETARYWLKEIEKAEKYHDDFWTTFKELEDRYLMEDRIDDDAIKDYNIFWSNVNTLQPALYARTPIPQVERRFKDKDIIGKLASQVLERASIFSISCNDFDAIAKDCRNDYLIGGRGQCWLRYVPYVDKISLQVADETTTNGELETDDTESPIYKDKEGVTYPQDAVEFDDEQNPYFEKMTYEEAVIEYVHWRDFLHNKAKKWSDVRWVARRVHMSKADAKKRFNAEAVKLLEAGDKDDKKDSGNDVEQSSGKSFEVYEIWCKTTKKAYWVSKLSEDALLDEKDDPLKLKNFFPCPRPLSATTTNSCVLPKADFLFYQDQANAITDITTRIGLLVEALVVAGVYDSTVGELKDLLDGTAENKLIPVKNWSYIKDKGGLSGVIDFVPLDVIAGVLDKMYQAREQEFNAVYQITGMSDIVRGYSDPSTTATAEQLKGQFATLRLADKQAELQRFLRDAIAIMAEIIAEQFAPETIELMSGTDMLAEIDPSLQPEAFQEAVALLRNDVLRQYRITIETDSTLAVNEQAEKEAVNEFMGAFTSLSQQTLGYAQQAPELLPMAKEAMMFAFRRFKAGRNLESVIENSFDALIANIQQQQEQPPQPSPEELKAQADQQAAEIKMQFDQVKAQNDSQIKQMSLQIKEQEAQAKMALAQQEAQFKQQLSVQEVSAKLQLEREKLVLETQLAQEKIRADMATSMMKQSSNQADRIKPETTANEPVIPKKTTHVMKDATGNVTKIVESTEMPLSGVN